MYPEDVKFFRDYLDERTSCEVQINGIVPHGEGVVVLFTEINELSEYARCAGFELIEYARVNEETPRREWRCKFNMIVSA